MDININNKILRNVFIVFAVFICAFMFNVNEVSATVAYGPYYYGCCANNRVRTAVNYSTSNSDTSTTVYCAFGTYDYNSASVGYDEYTSLWGYINGENVYSCGVALRRLADANSYKYRGYSGTYSRTFTRKCTDYSVPLRVWFSCNWKASGDSNPKGTHTRDDIVAYASIPAHSHYTISYNANTIDTNGDSLISSVSGVPSSQRKCINSNITLSSSSPTCKYYKFKGWSTNKSASTGSYNPGATYSTNSSVTLYAIWEKVEFDVALDQQGATKNGTTTAKATYNGAWNPNPITLPERTGYTFHGFFSKTGGNGTQYYNEKGYYVNSWTTLGEGTIYAYWTANDYNVRLYPRNPQTGDNTAKDITVTYDSSYNNKVTIPTTTGYVCTGYYDDPITGQQIFDGDGKWVAGSCWDSTGHWIKPKNMILYAHWEVAPIEGAVVFDNQGGTGGPEKMSVTYGQSSYIPTEVPTKKRSTFIYWSTSADGSGIKYYQNAPFPGEVNDEYYNNYVDKDGNVDPVVLYAIYDGALDPEDSIAEQNIIYNIYESNVKEGLLDAGIEYNYKNFFGQVKQILSRKSIILDNSSEVSEDDAVAVGTGKWKVGDPIPGLDSYLPEDSYVDEDGNIYIKVDDDGIKRISTEEELVKYIAEITAKNNETDEEGNFVNRNIPPYQIQLQNDIQLSSTLVIPEDLNVEIDLDGHTLSGQGCDIIKTQGNLEITNGSILGCKDKYIIIVDGGMVNVDSTAYLYSDSTGCTCIYVTSKSGTANINGASLNTTTSFKSDSETAYIIGEDNVNIRCSQYFAEEYDKTTMGTVELKLGYYEQDPSEFIDTDHYAVKDITGDYKYQVVEDEKSLTTVNIEANTVNPGIVTGTGKYAYNSTAKLTATGGENTYFLMWIDSEGNEVTNDSANVIEVLRSNDSGTLEIKAKENTLYTAVFAYYLWEVQIECEHGTASGATTYEQGSKATITIDDVEDGYRFEKWVNATTGAELSTDKTYEFTVKDEVEIKAVFSEKEYTLTYNANGGTNAPASETMTVSSENYITKETPTYKNKGFLLWNTKQDGSGDSYKAGDLFKGAGDLKKDTTLYAQWAENTVLLAFDANGGAGAPEAMTLKYSQMYKIPDATPTKDGVSFRFWNTKENGSGTTYNPGDIIKEANYLPTSNIILYAQWTSNESKILYYDQGATSFSGKHADGYPETYSSNANTTLLSATKEGYVFEGWYTNSDCTGSPITSITAGTYTGDISLYAKWTEKTATLTYDANGGTNVPDSVTIRYSKPCSVTTTTPTRTGYVFTGWNTKANGNGTDYKSGKTIKAENVVPTDTTLYAQWTEITAELAFDANGGTGAPTSIIMKYTSSVILSLVVPTKTGSTFAGWNTKPDGSGTSYASGAEFKAANVVPTDTTLYAQWISALCFTANEAGSTISMSVTGTPTLGQNFQYSMDGQTWKEFVVGTTKITLPSKGNFVYFKGNNPNGVSESDSIYYNFVMTGSISASGNIMSLIDDGACMSTIIPNGFCFKYLFKDCTSLTTTPSLPATTLVKFCYYHMFDGCTSLTTAPSLPATTLATGCYCYMFYGCTSLTTAPELPATILASWCYQCMFGGCTSLTTAPSLPATTLESWCYSYMFYECTSLTTAPSLPATKLISWCYYHMFYGCTSLIVSDTSGSGYSKTWRIPKSGTFTNTYAQSDMFTNCAGTRSSNDMAGASGQSYTYYTQNEPV